MAGDEITGAADVPSALIDAALAIWSLPASTGLNIAVADLGGTALGRVIGNTSYLDDDAAGYGRFVDPTPSKDAEFGPGGAETDPIDLLTVLANEIGQLNDEVNDLVDPSLLIGVRHR